MEKSVTYVPGLNCYLCSRTFSIGNAGRNIRIGIIDSGINPAHPMFDDSGLSAPICFDCGDLAFTNNKVIVARNYVLPIYGLNPEPDTPEDKLGHGSQVAAIAAGRRVSAPLAQIQGIAPLAFLGNYRVFGTRGINSTTTSAAVIAAVNDAVADGMNVLNLSLGGDAMDPATDPEQITIANATAMGVVVVIAGGNSGPGLGTITSPGTSPAAITVGASSNERIFAGALEIDAVSVPPGLEQIPYAPGEDVTIDSATVPAPIVTVQPMDATELACEGLPAGTLTGKIALLRRGSCVFVDKAANVSAAGAVAMVVYNSEEGPPLTMAICKQIDETCDTIKDFVIPSVMITKSEGEALRDFLAGSAANATVQPLAPVAAEPDLIAPFSSRGPNINMEIKPDLTAPGQRIYTASNKVEPEPEYSLDLSGTSFSTPIVSGAAALAKQLHPGWSAETIKSVLVNTAAKVTTWNGEPARIVHTGSGRLDLARAVRAKAALDPVSMSFGIQGEDESIQIERSIRLTHHGSGTQTYQIEVQESFANPSVQLAVSPPSLTLASGQTKEFLVNAQFSPPLAPGTLEGYIRVSTSNSSDSELWAPYWGAVSVPDPSTVLQVSKTGNGMYDSIPAALEKAQPGNVVEISDSEIYPDVVEIGLNLEGLPLRGLTLRSKPGESPTIDATGKNSAAITIFDLDEITIEGLRIRGGRGGISFENASGLLHSNIIEDTAEGSDGVKLINSRAHIFRNTIQNHTRTGILASASAALIQGNEVSGNLEHGVFGFGGSDLALFENDIFENGSDNSGQGIRIVDSSALIKGSTVRDIPGESGDGIQAWGAQALLLIQDGMIERNQGRGVSLSDGALAEILRTQVRDNQDSGLYLALDASSETRSSQFTGNAKGIEMFDSSLTLLDSLVANSQHPSQADGIAAVDSVVSILNSTIARNARFGINFSGTSGTLFNSILSGNGENDFSGPFNGTLINNLIGDGQYPGSNGNFAGDPLFTNSAEGDFSLQSGSPAIDRGNNDLPANGSSAGFLLPRPDLLFYERPVDGNGDDIVEIDLGAIEFGSSWAQVLILPVLSSQDTEFLGVALANAFSETARVLLLAYDREGKPKGTSEREIAPRCQWSFLLAEVFPSLKEGWVEIRSTRPDVVSFTLLGNYAGTVMDGAALASASHRKLLFPEVQNESVRQTWFYLVNPHDHPLDATLRWRRLDGSTSEQTLQLAAKGMFSGTLNDLFGVGSGSGGYVTAEADEPLFGMELFGSPLSRGGLLALDQEAKNPVLFAAHLASDPDVETTLNLINIGPVTDILLEALDEKGDVIASRLLQDFPQGAQYRKQAREVFDFDSETVVGWLRITSGEGTLSGNISFGAPSGNFLAALPLQGETQGAREFLLSHVAQTAKMFTGVTLLNPFQRVALVSLEVFDQEKNLTGLSFLELSPREKVARLLNEFLPSLQEQGGGFIRIRSNVPIFSFELFGRYSLNFLAAVPQQVVVN